MQPYEHGDVKVDLIKTISLGLCCHENDSDFLNIVFNFKL